MNEKDFVKKMLSGGSVEPYDFEQIQLMAIKEWRFKFAGMAMQGALSNPHIANNTDEQSELAVKIADKLVKELLVNSPIENLMEELKAVQEERLRENKPIPQDEE